MEFTGEYFIPGKVENRIEEDHLSRYEFAKKFVRNAHVLDIACGVGYGSVPLLEGGAESYTGVDINESSIEYAGSTYGTLKTIYAVGDIVNYKGGLFNVITCFETIEHVKLYKEAIQNLYGLLKNNGVLIISTPNRIITSPYSDKLTDAPLNQFHSQEFIPQELKRILSEIGFTGIKQYGQRQRLWFNSKRYRKFFTKLFNPDFNMSPKVRPVCLLTPRYFILVAKKKS